ncbi:MAG: LamG-like jellyroll fold domain-containing protein [Kofleriaceae bacterium]
MNHAATLHPRDLLASQPTVRARRRGALTLAGALCALSCAACSVDDVVFSSGASRGDGGPLPDTPPGVVVLALSQPSLDVPEAADRTFTVALRGRVTESVAVTLTSSSPAKLAVTPAELTFAPGVDPTPLTVTVSGRADDDAVDEAASVLVAAAGIGEQTLAVAIADDDTLELLATPASGMDVTEGSSRTFTVRLGAQPQAPLTVAISSMNPAFATVSPAELSFDADSWNEEQIITVAGVQDANTVDEMTQIVLSSSDLPTLSVPLQVVDDDVLMVQPSTSSLGNITEGNASTFSVALSHQPPANVTVTVSSSSSALAVGPTSLTFTPINWASPQTITASAPQDADTAGAAVTISLSAAGLSTRTVSANVIDDDVQAIVVSPLSTTIVEGSTVSLSVRLAFQPASTVTVNAASLAPAALSVSPATLTFTTTDYATPKTVTVTAAQDDDAADGAGQVRLNAPGLSTDVSLDIDDDDVLAISASTTSVSLSEGGTATFGVRLTANPISSVTVSIASSDTGAAAASPTTLTFNSTNWPTLQTVTVTGIEDIDLAAETVTITLSAPGFSSVSVSAFVSDNDTQAILVSPTSLTIDEGDGGDVQIALQYMPAGTTIVTLSASNGKIGLSQTSLAFTPANYSVPQLLGVAGTQDADSNDDTSVITVASGGLASRTVNVTVIDDDRPPTTGLHLWLNSDVGIQLGTGALVAGWLDQSGNGRDATMATVARQPTLVTAALNGHPVLRFSGAQSLALTSFTQTTTFTVFVVGRNTRVGGVSMILGPGGSSPNNQMRWESSTQALFVGTGNGMPVSTSTIGNTMVFHSLSARYDGSSMIVYRDGSPTSTHSFTTSGPWILAQVGAYYGSEFMQGEVAEVMIYDRALSDTERNTVNNYLRTKYNLP